MEFLSTASAHMELIHLHDSLTWSPNHRVICAKVKVLRIAHMGPFCTQRVYNWAFQMVPNLSVLELKNYAHGDTPHTFIDAIGRLHCLTSLSILGMRYSEVIGDGIVLNEEMPALYLPELQSLAIDGVTEKDVLPLSLIQAHGHGSKLRRVQLFKLPPEDTWDEPITKRWLATLRDLVLRVLDFGTSNGVTTLYLTVGSATLARSDHPMRYGYTSAIFQVDHDNVSWLTHWKHQVTIDAVDINAQDDLERTIPDTMLSSVTLMCMPYKAEGGFDPFPSLVHLPKLKEIVVEAHELCNTSFVVLFWIALTRRNIWVPKSLRYISISGNAQNVYLFRQHQIMQDPILWVIEYTYHNVSGNTLCAVR